MALYDATVTNLRVPGSIPRRRTLYRRPSGVAMAVPLISARRQRPRVGVSDIAPSTLGKGRPRSSARSVYTAERIMPPSHRETILSLSDETTRTIHLVTSSSSGTVHSGSAAGRDRMTPFRSSRTSSDMGSIAARPRPRGRPPM